MSRPVWLADETAPIATEVLDTAHGRVSLTVAGPDAVLSVSILFHSPEQARSVGEELYGLMLQIDADQARRSMS